MHLCLMLLMGSVQKQCHQVWADSLAHSRAGQGQGDSRQGQVSMQWPEPCVGCCCFSWSGAGRLTDYCV